MDTFIFCNLSVWKPLQVLIFLDIFTYNFAVWVSLCITSVWISLLLISLFGHFYICISLDTFYALKTFIFNLCFGTFIYNLSGHILCIENFLFTNYWLILKLDSLKIVIIIIITDCWQVSVGWSRWIPSIDGSL